MAMFIYAPLAVVLGSCIALAVLVWRKWPFLKKLEPDAHPVGRTFLHDLAPEAAERLGVVQWQSLWRHALAGTEGSLGALRSAFAAVGQASERMMSSVKTVKENVRQRQEQAAEPVLPAAPETVRPMRNDTAEQERLLKVQEQRLIVDIAQDPKNADLYQSLARVYAKLGNLPDAAESLRAAAKLAPDDAELAERLARLQARVEKAEKKSGEEV